MIPTGELSSPVLKSIYKSSDLVITYIISSKQTISLHKVWIWSHERSHDSSMSQIMTQEPSNNKCLRDVDKVSITSRKQPPPSRHLASHSGCLLHGNDHSFCQLELGSMELIHLT